MAILFGVFWLLASIAMGLFVRGNVFKGKHYYKIGLSLIILSFVCGFSLLLAVLFTI